MSLSTTYNSVNIEDTRHIIYLNQVEFHGESKSSIRITISPTVTEIHQPEWMNIGLDTKTQEER